MFLINLLLEALARLLGIESRVSGTMEPCLVDEDCQPPPTRPPAVEPAYRFFRKSRGDVG